MAVAAAATAKISIGDSTSLNVEADQTSRNYEALFGRAVEVIDMGEMGHTAALCDPAVYVELLEQAMS